MMLLNLLVQHCAGVSTQHTKKGSITINNNESKLLIGLEKLIQGLINFINI